MTQSIRTTIRDSILASVSEELDRDEVQGVEWAAVQSTVAAVRDPQPRLVDWDTYNEVGL